VRAVVQRVSAASVSIDGEIVGRIERGLLVLAGAEAGDTRADLDYVAQKVATLRVFENDEGRMDLDVAGAGGAVLVVSQFTLLGDVRKGRRPSFSQAMPPGEAAPFLDAFVAQLGALGLHVETGRFGADMAVALVNDGPVTILIDSRRLF
jgi:D-tyrosyl-tRNA(Tyr) deacylase